MPDDVPRDMRHLSKQFPGLRTFIPSNPREGRRCSLYAASERPRPCCDQRRFIPRTNEPGVREVHPRGACGRESGPARTSPGGAGARDEASGRGGEAGSRGVPGRAWCVAARTGLMMPVTGPGQTRVRIAPVRIAPVRIAQCGWHSADGRVQKAAGRKQRARKEGPPKARARKAQGPHGSRGVLQSPTENWYATGHLRALRCNP
jgi:hypothetical protein